MGFSNCGSRDKQFPHSTQDLSSWTRAQTRVPYIGRQTLNHWTTGKVDLTSRFQVRKPRFRGLYTPVLFPPESISGFLSLPLQCPLEPQPGSGKWQDLSRQQSAGVYLACCPPRAGGPLAPIPAGRQGRASRQPRVQGQGWLLRPTVILTTSICISGQASPGCR